MPRLKLKIVPLPESKELENYRGMIADHDLPVLVAAIDCGADDLVTGDKKHFGKLGGREGIPLKICSPSEFVEVLSEVIKVDRLKAED